ncbi:MAG: aminotransferase class I/II-fold pyridoxal phosphate-dependent enzyme, partial [Proteobacteria bacterium]|nr:aminotransferase class I/II-fold pyridoxal phosphate-dependent enzyme [Pseudomonadota bacterium]
MKKGDSSYGHGGNVHAVSRAKGLELESILDFSANINPLGPPEWLRSCVSRELDSILHYPDPSASELAGIISERYRVPLETVLVANGSTELLYQLPRVLDCKRAVIPTPCYIDYIKVMELAGIPVHTLPLDPEQDFVADVKRISDTLMPGDLLILGTPNNPTGKCVAAADIIAMSSAHPQVL